MELASVRVGLLQDEKVKSFFVLVSFFLFPSSLPLY